MGLKIRWKAVNEPGTAAYYDEPYTVQHFTDWLKDMFWGKDSLVMFIPFVLHQMVSKKAREKWAHQVNEMMFGYVPQNQVVVFDDHGGHHTMTDEERQRWLGR